MKLLNPHRPASSATALAAFVIGLMSGAAGPSDAQAQTIHRCGSAYSHLPCPAGRVVDVADTRSVDQRDDARSVVDRDRRLAAEMRRDRLADQALQKPGAAASLGGAPTKALPHPAAAPTKKPKKRRADAVVTDRIRTLDPEHRR